RLVAQPVELVHPLERRGVVAEGDDAIADLGHALRRLLGREAAGHDPSIASLAAVESLLVASDPEKRNRESERRSKGLRSCQSRCHCAGAYSRFWLQATDFGPRG